MRRARVVFCALVLGIVLGACGGDGEPAGPIRTFEPETTASSPSPEPLTDQSSEGCQLLTPDDRRSIAGEKLDTFAPMPPIEGALQCRWVKTLTTPRTTSIKVVSQPPHVWLQQVPIYIDTLVASGRSDAEYSKRLQSLKKRVIRAPEDVSDEQACKYFSLLVEISFDKKGLTKGLQFQRTQFGDYMVAWQQCGGGVHTGLVYEEPGLQVSRALGQSVARLGKLAHRRAVNRLE